VLTPSLALRTVTTEDLQHRLDTRTKPQGSLGKLETLAIRIGLALQSEQPRFTQPRIMVFAGDHGIAPAGVSAFPQDVTAQMVMNYLSGGAAINVLARQLGLALAVIDAGVASRLQPAPGLLDRSIGRGTRNYLQEPAMTVQQRDAAIATGRELAAAAIADGSNALLVGEMGIGNTASAAMLVHRVTGWPLEDCVGRGTGLDDAGLSRKLHLLHAASARCPGKLSPLEALAEFGGFELAMIVGAIVEATRHRCLVVIDGFAVSVAALIASGVMDGSAARADASIARVNASTAWEAASTVPVSASTACAGGRPTRDAPAAETAHAARSGDALSHCVFSHCSAEKAHRALLRHLDVQPLLDLELRLGEASGAALAWPLIDSSARLLSDMASFESAGVSDRT
jgi:nicotinate-nucleotide--dimethylbenzimidazole phosphoribosyltransferase